ncbi:ALG6, ALG8 glycosyltransferase [Neoconidiobolus thromboides FSU 785]|nr:ALG6, ALG8 glycosyltransferase [Neoconidiobolus thromboides FSU 785]
MEKNKEDVIEDTTLINKINKKLTYYYDTDYPIKNFLLIVLVALLLRLTVALGNYSGFGKSPLYGDFEAQRHWLEITLNLKPKTWYFYDLQYWGLDYPPVTGYHSLLLAKIGNYINPSWFELVTSRGNEDKNLKIFMRLTVVFSEILTFVLPLFMFVLACMDIKAKKELQLKSLFTLSFILFNPLLIIIDHGHFQYNCVMLGFLIFSLYYIQQKDYIKCSVFFCLCVGFKQMALYYSLPIFAYLLAKCLFPMNLIRLIKIGATVIVTFGCLLYPLIYQENDWLDIIKQVFIRIFPLQRGLFEDKVANFWCSLNILIKLRNYFKVDELAKISALTTLITCLPSFYKLLRKPSMPRLLLTLTIHSFSFFLFSFQVHEKSILLPTLPLFLFLFVIKAYDIKKWNTTITNENVVLFTNVAMFSLYPLIKKDNLISEYYGLILFFNTLFNNTSITNRYNLIYLPIIIWHIAELFLLPPTKLPDIFTVLNQAYASVVFLGFWLILNVISFYKPVTKSKKE